MAVSTGAPGEREHAEGGRTQPGAGQWVVRPSAPAWQRPVVPALEHDNIRHVVGGRRPAVSGGRVGPVVVDALGASPGLAARIPSTSAGAAPRPVILNLDGKGTDNVSDDPVPVFLKPEHNPIS